MQLDEHGAELFNDDIMTCLVTEGSSSALSYSSAHIHIDTHNDECVKKRGDLIWHKYWKWKAILSLTR